MKILQVITSLMYGGAEKLVAEISPMLRDRGHQVDVLAFSGAEPNFIYLLEEKGIKVMTFGKDVNVYNPVFIFKLAKIMKGYDVVHTHNTSPQYFVAIASLWSRHKASVGFKGIQKVSCLPKLVYTEHNTANRMRSIPGFSLFLKWVYSRYDKNICISDKAEENLHAYLPSLTNLCTIYNGVNVHKFHDAMPIEGLRSPLRMAQDRRSSAQVHPEGKIVVVMVAAFRPQKDQDTLIKAFRHLPEDRYELWIVGDGERRSVLEALAENMANIKFLGIRSDVAEVLHTADIVVMSSHYEGLSLSSIEGMAVGKPFVASDVDGLHEVVDGYGVLVPHQDEMALAGEIVHLASDQTYYQQVADKCWERAKQYDIEKMALAYQKVYEGLFDSL